jgi:hypothetical protein
VKLGCNTGGCHGKASGQNGFKLSILAVWLAGGPTHMETFDPKPDAPAEFRGL